MSIAVWHAHHKCASPLEFIESFETRTHTIDTVKAQYESDEQVALRKKLFKLAQNIETVPSEFESSSLILDEAYRKWFLGLTTSAAVEQLHKEWLEVLKRCLPEILRIHEIECGCAWTPENDNIFEYGFK